MKYSWSIFTKTALTVTLLSGVAPVGANPVEADIHLDALDADGHLSILQNQQYIAEAKAESSKVEPLVKKTKVETVVATEAVEKKVGAKYSAKEAANTESYGNKFYAELAAASKVEADAHGGDHGKSYGGTDTGFLTKSTTEVEFTFAILVIIIGLIASERFQRAKDEQMQDDEGFAAELQPIEES